MPVRRLSGEELGELAGQILQAGHSVRFQARGGSMHPFIRDGGIIEVAPMGGKAAKRGEVVLVDDGKKRLFAHRVVKTGFHDGQPVYLIKGDTCPLPDGWFQEENILGHIVWVEHASQGINPASVVQRWKANLWVGLSPWIPKFPWLPGFARRCVRRLLWGF